MYDDTRDIYGAWFCGWVYGWLACLAFVLLSGGCWRSTEAAAPTAPVVRVAAPVRWSCDRLVSVAGPLPPQADLAECVADEESYWYCSSRKAEDEASALRSWAETAIGVCAP